MYSFGRVPYPNSEERSGLEQSWYPTPGHQYNIALGGLVAAGLDGIAKGRIASTDMEVDVDPVTIPATELERLGIRRLPTSLDKAVSALETDLVLMDAMGKTLATSYIAIRRGDSELFGARDEAFELRHHFYKY